MGPVMVHNGCWVLVVAVVSVYGVYGPSILHVKVELINLPQLHLCQNVMRGWQFVKLFLSGVCEQAYCEELQSSSCLFSPTTAQNKPTNTANVHTSALAQTPAAVLLLPYSSRSSPESSPATQKDSSPATCRARGVR